IVSSSDALLLRQDPGGSLATHADLAPISNRGWDEIVVDGRGNAYVNGGGVGLLAGWEFAPGREWVGTPGGGGCRGAGGDAFPSGRAGTPDDSTRIVAESYAKKLTAFDIAADGGLSNRRVWRISATESRMGSVWMRKAGSGTRTFPTSVVCGLARAAKCCKRSTWTSAALPVSSADRTGKRWSWWSESGEALKARPTSAGSVKCLLS